MNLLGLRRIDTCGRRRPLPFGAPEIALAILVAVAEFAFFNEPLTLRSGPSALAGVVIVAVAPRWPLLATALSGPFAAISSYVTTDTGTFSIFFILILVELVTAKGMTGIGLMLVLVHSAVGMIDFSNRILSTDPVVAAIMLTLLVTSYFIGVNRLSHAVNNAYLRQSLADSQRSQRLGLARDLHDSVATSLTGVVMRSQALELTATKEEDGDIREGLEAISRASRTALEELRTMLQLLNSDASPNLDNSAIEQSRSSVRSILNAAILELKAYNLRVHTRIESLNTAEPPVDRATLSRILTEMTSNAVKHSPDRAEVLVTSQWSAQKMTVTMENPIRAGHQTCDPALSSHLGLGSMIARAQAAGGELSAGPLDNKKSDADPGVWQTAVSLPIVGAVTTPRRSP